MQAQMTPATAPGIAGLMRGMPQGKPPTPQPQQGAQPQGLNAIDPRTMQALGLQKALQKAEMEAASLRQQAMNQQTPQMSVAEQNLQKLAALEAEKMAPQSAQNQAPIVADTSRREEQAAMDRLRAMASQGGAGGIARAPGANQVVPPQGMAGGGIVAFQEGGEAPSAVDQREVQRILRKSPMMRTPEENAILRQAGLKLEQRQMGPEGIIQRAERGLQQVGPAARQYLTEGAQGLSPEDLEQRSDAGAVTEKIYRMFGGQQARPPVPGMSEADLQDLMPTRQPLPQTPIPPEMEASPTPPPPLPPPPTPKPAPGVQPAMGAAAALDKPAFEQITPGGVVPRPALEAPFTKAAQDIFSRDPEAVARQAQERFGAAMDPAEAQRRKVIEEIMGQRRKALEGMPSQREQDLQRMFAGLRNVGAGGQKGIGGFAAGSQAQASQFQRQKQNYQQQLNELLIAEANRGVDVAGKRLGVEEKAREGVGADIRAAMPSASGVISSQIGAQSRAEEGKLDRANARAIAKAQIEAQAKPGEAERIYAQYDKIVREQGPKAADEYLQIMGIIKGGNKRDTSQEAMRNKLELIKVLQNRVDPMKNMDAEDRKKAAVLLRQAESELMRDFGMGGGAAAGKVDTSNPLLK